MATADPLPGGPLAWGLQKPNGELTPCACAEADAVWLILGLSFGKDPADLQRLCEAAGWVVVPVRVEKVAP